MPQNLNLTFESCKDIMEPIYNDMNMIYTINFFRYSKDILKDSIADLLDMRLIETVFVPHCKLSTGLALTHKDGWKIVYSGDTKPYYELVKIGMLF